MALTGKRILVTGAAGFIGSHLCELLVHEGAKVRALVEYNSFNDWGWLEGSEALDSLEVFTGDIRDAYLCRSAMDDIEIVMHLAALIPIPYSYRAPESYIQTNVTGTLHLCQAARDAGTVKRFIQMSTSETYGTAQYVPIDEQHPMRPQSPYSASKIGADAVALSQYYSFGLPVVIARPFNTYGPRQSARAVIPTIISQLASGMKEIKLGDTRTTRDFTFVTDTAYGLALLAEMQGGDGEVYNIGSNFEISVGDLFTKIAGMMAPDAKYVTDTDRLRGANTEVFRLWCNNEKLRKATNFSPKVSLDEGLKQTVAWFLDPRNLARYKPGMYNV